MSILSVPITFRSLQRLRHIVATFTRHGFDHYVTRLKLRRYLPWGRRFKPRAKTAPPIPETEDRIGKRLVAICEELGPTFVKLGQLLSSRPDILSPDVIDDLQSLQHRVGVFPTDQAKKILEEDFNHSVADLFAEFDPVPIASGSIAQTYRATKKDGQQVVVKVRRPGIETTIQLDMYLLHRMAKNVEKYMPELQSYHPVATIEEFAQSLNRELDFVNEGTVTERVHQFLADDSNIEIPRVHWELTSSRVLTLTFLTGRNFHEALRDPDEYVDRKTLARVLVDACVRQYLELGLFHADPHPGNILINAPDRIGIIDFGMAGRLDRTRSTSLVVLLMASISGYYDLVVDVLTDLRAINDETDPALFKRDLATLVEKYKALPLKHMALQVLFTEIMALTREHRVKLPRDFVLMGKSLVNVSGPALMLDPDMNVAQVIKPQVHRALLALVGKENLGRELSLAVWHGGMLLKDLPHQTRNLLRKANRGELRFQMELQGMDPLLKELDRSSNRISFAMVLAAIIIGSSIVFHAGIGPTWSGLPLLGLTGYIFAAVLGLWLVLAILRSGKLS